MCPRTLPKKKQRRMCTRTRNPTRYVLSPDTSAEDPATQLLPRVTYPSPPSHPRAQTVPRSRVLDKRRPIPNAYSSPHTQAHCHMAPADLSAPPVIGASGDNPASAGKPSRRKSKRPRPPRHVVPHPFPTGPPPDLASGPSDPREPTARIRLAPPQRPAPAYKYAPRARSPPARHSRIAPHRIASSSGLFTSRAREHCSGSPLRVPSKEKEKKKEKRISKQDGDDSTRAARRRKIKKRIRRGATGRPPRAPRSVLLPRRSSSGAPSRGRRTLAPGSRTRGSSFFRSSVTRSGLASCSFRIRVALGLFFGVLFDWCGEVSDSGANLRFEGCGV
jgi:hypothetical protein